VPEEQNHLQTPHFGVLQHKRFYKTPSKEQSKMEDSLPIAGWVHSFTPPPPEQATDAGQSSYKRASPIRATKSSPVSYPALNPRYTQYKI